MPYGPRVNRRWIGLMVLFVVILGVSATARVAHRQVAGTGQIGPIPGPPSIGDCLLEPVGRRSRAVQTEHAAVATGPGEGRRYGEVVSVISAAQVQPFRQDINDGSVVDPNLDICENTTVLFLGLGAGPGHPANPAVPGHPINVFTYWSPVLLTSFFYAAGPSALQTSMGQRWLACISYVPDATTQTSVPYDRSARGTFTTGTPPTVYAACLETADAAMLSIINCSLPHAAEIFGYRFAEAATPRPALDATCTAMIKKFTGMSDPSAGGRLTAKTVAAGGSANPASIDATAGGAISCLVTAPTGHHLNGPLMNLGNKPLPLD